MNYDLMVVASAKANTGAFLTKLKKTLSDVGASNVKVDEMGRKKLAYVIKKQDEADYFSVNFEAEGSSVNNVRDMLQLEQETVLRYLITKVSLSKVKGKEQVREKSRVTVKTKTESKAAKSKEPSTSSKSSKKKVKAGKKK